MNDLQKKEYELLKIFLKICNELNLKYYLVCGSALGTVKYHGFIPWDDDIDVALPRKDYEIFIKEATTYLPSNVFLQNYKTDPLYYGLGSKLRNSNTTYIEKGIEHISINHGVYIDVFPLDGYPMEKTEQKKFEKKKKYFYRRRYVRLRPFWHRDLGLTVCSLLYRLTGAYSNTQKYVSENEKLISEYNISTSDILCNHANSVRKIEYAPKSQYGEGTWGVFEGLKVRIPERYDEYLTQKYGDWCTELPKEKQMGHHYYSVCDLSKSYIEYIK